MKKIVCTRCGSEELLVTESLNPNDHNRICDYFTDAYPDKLQGLCLNCNEVQTLDIVEAEDASDEDPWRCEDCGSTDVEYTDNGTLGDRNDFWCNYCEEHTRQVRESELMAVIQNWFNGELQPEDSEVISGLDPDDYGREEAYLDACTDHWNSLSNEQKISIWKQLTYDKRCNENC